MLYQTILKYLNKQPGVDPATPRILLLAPTGKTVYLLRSNTIHSALKILVNQSFEYKSLDSDRLNTLRNQLKYLWSGQAYLVTLKKGFKKFSHLHTFWRTLWRFVLAETCL